MKYGKPSSVQLRSSGVMHRKYTDVIRTVHNIQNIKIFLYIQYNKHLCYLIKKISRNSRGFPLLHKREIMHILQNVYKTLNVNSVCDR